MKRMAWHMYTVEPCCNAPDCDGFPVTTFSSVGAMRRLMKAVHWFPACCIRTIRLFGRLCCVRCAAAGPKRVEKFQEERYEIAAVATLRDTTKQSFWRLGSCGNVSLIQFTLKPQSVLAPRSSCLGAQRLGRSPFLYSWETIASIDGGENV